MTKKHFVALADELRLPGMIPATVRMVLEDHTYHIEAADVLADRIVRAISKDLARFCKQQNSNFDRDRWLGYIRGENGPSGGKV